MSRKELARAGLGKAALARRITNRPGVAAAQLAIRRGCRSCATEPWGALAASRAGQWVERHKPAREAPGGPWTGDLPGFRRRVERDAASGDLIQVDGSPSARLEARGPATHVASRDPRRRRREPDPRLPAQRGPPRLWHARRPASCDPRPPLTLYGGRLNVFVRSDH